MTDINESAAGVDRLAAIESILGTISGSRLRSFVAILIVSFVAFLPGFKTIPPLDRDEPYYAIETKLIAASGDPSAATSSSLLGYLQPIGINWLQLLSISVAGEGPGSPIWIYRLPSLFAAVAVTLLTWWMALAFGRPRAALFAAFLIATTPLLVAEAHLAKTDAVLLAAIVLAQGALARLWRAKTDGPDYRYAFLFWTGLGIGILVKGLIAPLVIGLTIVVLSVPARSFRWLARLAPIAGVIWLAIITVPWFLAAALAGTETAAETSLPANVALQQAYEAPPGSYAVLFYPLFGPTGVFVALAIPGVIERIRRPVFLFAVAWVAPFWLIVELWPVKLPYYILPAYPALALVGATAIDEGWLRLTGWISTYFSLNLLVWPLLVSIGATLLFLAGEDGLPIKALPFFIGGIVAGAYALIWFYRGSSVSASAVLSVLSALLLYVGLFGDVFAKARSLQISGRAVAEGKASVSCNDPKFVSTGFFEPSLVFYAGNDIRLTSPEEAADFLAAGGCRVAFVESRRQSIFNQEAEDIGLELNVKHDISGFDIGNWKKTKIRIFAVEGPSP